MKTIPNLGRAVPSMGTIGQQLKSRIQSISIHKPFVTNELHSSNASWHRSCSKSGCSPMRHLKKSPTRSEIKQRLVLLMTANEKVSSFRNSAKSTRTLKKIVQALRSGAPLAIRTSVN